MKNFNEAALSLATRISDHLGPLTPAIDYVMDHLTTKQVAKACPNYYCTEVCTSQPCWSGLRWGANYYASYYILCLYHSYNCPTVYTCDCN